MRCSATHFKTAIVLQIQGKGRGGEIKGIKEKEVRDRNYFQNFHLRWFHSTSLLSRAQPGVIRCRKKRGNAVRMSKRAAERERMNEHSFISVFVCKIIQQNGKKSTHRWSLNQDSEENKPPGSQWADYRE